MPKKIQAELKEFQSHIGAIRITVFALAALELGIHFNPTLVQLEFHIHPKRTCEDEFQSHIGAIRITVFALAALELGIHFNPTLVQLESFVTLLSVTPLLYFNPTLVQLECKLPSPAPVPAPSNFNPTLVQLEWR